MPYKTASYAVNNMKIAILGYSGSGKSTLAARFGKKYGIPVLFLDTVQFKPNWEVRDRAESERIVRSFLENPEWVIDGNYTAFAQRERLKDADRIIIITLNRFVCFFRAYRRYIAFRGRTRESMADGCDEKFDAEFVRWLLWEGRTKKRAEHFASIAREFPEKTEVIRNTRELDRLWIREFGEKP